jgi:hypothetical protein
MLSAVAQIDQVAGYPYKYFNTLFEELTLVVVLLDDHYFPRPNTFGVSLKPKTIGESISFKQ